MRVRVSGVAWEVLREKEGQNDFLSWWCGRGLGVIFVNLHCWEMGRMFTSEPPLPDKDNRGFTTKKGKVITWGFPGESRSPQQGQVEPSTGPHAGLCGSPALTKGLGCARHRPGLRVLTMRSEGNRQGLRKKQTFRMASESEKDGRERKSGAWWRLVENEPGRARGSLLRSLSRK